MNVLAREREEKRDKASDKSRHTDGQVRADAKRVQRLSIVDQAAGTIGTFVFCSSLVELSPFADAACVVVKVITLPGPAVNTIGNCQSGRARALIARTC